MTTKKMLRLDRLERATHGEDWRQFIGKPDNEWSIDAQTARFAEELLGRPVPNLDALSDADLEKAIVLANARPCESKINEGACP